MGAVENIITDNLTIWSSAVQSKSSVGRGTRSKRNLYGVKKLRELILDLAVRGLLVPQDPNDEPASVLLEKIAAEKEEQIKGGKIKKSKPLPSVEKAEERVIPTSWEFIRFGAGINVLNGRAYKKNEMLSEGTPLLRVGNLFTSNDWYYSDLQLEPQKYIDNGDLIYAWSASFGPFIWEGGKVIYHYHIWKLDFYDDMSLSKNYVYLYLLNETAAIKASGNGITMVHMTKERMEKLLLPVPPLVEQHRIVAKVDELMALCDTLEQQQEDSIKAHETLVEALLEALTSAIDADASQAAWQRIAEHFDVLFTTEHSIDKLKETILQLAVMGKLVSQDPNDEPAGVLLHRIVAEKEQLIKDKKIKKYKPSPAVSSEEMSFELPDGWIWCRVWDVASIITSGSRGWAKYYSDSGAMFLTMGNLSRGSYTLRMKNIRYVSPPVSGEGKRTSLTEGDLLISITGDVGNLGLIPSGFGESYINQHTALLRLMPECKGRFIAEFMRSPFAKYQFDAPQRGIKNSFRLGDVGEMIMALPPLLEQYRIVAKVDELMALCDQLKDSLQQVQQTQIHLTDAVVRNAL